MTILNITKHSALVKWTKIAAKDCLGILQGYRISYTDSSRKKSLGKSLLLRTKQQLRATTERLHTDH